MKKILLTLSVGLSSLAYSQTLHFTDSKFKTLLLSSAPGNQIAKDINGNPIAIDTNGDGEIQYSEALQVNILNIDAGGNPPPGTLPGHITDALLFTNLEELYVRDTQSAVISFTNNPKIKKVLYTGSGGYIDHTGTWQAVPVDFSFDNCAAVQDINQFLPAINPYLTNETILKFKNCPQLTGDIVLDSKAVKELYIENATITSIRFNSCYRLEKLYLPNLGSLTSILISGSAGNQTYSQNGIQLIANNCSNLEEIIADTDHYYSQGAYFTAININGCSNLKKLKGINATTIDFSNAGLTRLEELDCSFYNRNGYTTTSGVYFGNVTSLNLAGLPQLKIVKAFNQPITNTVNFSTATALQHIDITNSCGYMNTVNISSLPNLHTLKADRSETPGTPGNDNLQKIIAENCIALTNFEFKNNSGLKELDLQNCQGLQSLTIGNYYVNGGSFPELNKINIQQCSGLKEVIIQMTGITSLDVSECTALKSLDLLWNNLLTTVNMPANTNLENLNVSGHPLLAQADTSNNTHLKNVNFSNCPLITQLDFSNSPDIAALSLSNMSGLTNVNIRNGSIAELYDFSGYNFNLSMCVDDAEFNDLQSMYPDISFTINCGNAKREKNPEIALKTGIKVFPNPVKNVLQIQSDERIENIKIFDPQGKLIFNQDFDRNIVTIDFSAYSNALYIMKIKTEKTDLIKKIIKE